MFIARKQWIVVGSDDMKIHVFNYNTQERIISFVGHQDYIRFLEVHPSQPYVISTSDDMTTKLWDWEKGWSCVQNYEGHAHYVMMAKINPKDTNTYATASLDRTVKVWSLGSPFPNFSLEGHDRGVNCVDYYHGGDKPYIVSGADDQTIRVWDYQTRSCVSVLEGHTNNVCTVAFHPRLPFILSGSEDGTVRVWHNTTYRLESTLNYGFERVWAIACNTANNKVALGFDDGTIVIKLGREVPIASMDKNGKILLARNNVIYSSSVRTVSLVEDGVAEPTPAPTTSFVDGERIALAEKELGSVELFPQLVTHNPNGRFVAVVGDNEFVIYTSQALRNKTFGAALDFAWSAYGIGDYGVRESTSKVVIFRNFKESASFKPAVSAEAISGGALFCVRSSDAVCFYDWESSALVRRIEVAARSVYWNEEGGLVCIASDDAFFVLKFNRDVASAALSAGGAEVLEEGVEAAFELQHEVADKVRSGTWVGDCFIYTNSSNRLNYYVGGEVITLAHLDRRMYVLGYLAKEGVVFLIDKATAVVAYSLSLSVLEYQTAVVRKDFATANQILPEVPKDQLNSIAKFLEGQGYKEQALAVADDVDIKFDLALQLNKLDLAHQLLRSASSTADAAVSGAGAAPGSGSSNLSAAMADHETQSKWKQLMDLALATSNIPLAEECGLAARDLGALLLIYSSSGNEKGMLNVAQMASEDGVDNIAFLAYHSIGRVQDCMALLQKGGRGLEAECMRLVYGEESKGADSSEQPQVVLKGSNKEEEEERVTPTISLAVAQNTLSEENTEDIIE